LIVRKERSLMNLPAQRNIAVNRRLRRTIRLSLAALLFVSAASAEPKDKAALDLAKQAIEVDYLGTNFAQAEAKLKKALAMCKGNACSAKVIGQINRDLGVVAIAGLKKIDEGKQHLAEALKADPAVQLDPDLTTPEIQAAFDEAKGGGAAAAAEPAAAEDEEDEEAPAAPPAAEGDLVHDPPAEQAVLTPVPIYAELPEGMKASKVTVRYKPFGGAWKSVDMSKVKNGWGAEIPCLDVGSTTGNLSYFIQAMNAQGDLVAFSGTRSAPHQVPIKNELEGDPPNLPGKPPPAQCADTADCPPEFPGCNNTDESGADEEGLPGQPAARNWVSIGAQMDLLVLSSAKGVCSGEDYACFFEDDTYYDQRPYEASDGGNEVKGGFRRATTRFLLGYDRILGGNIGVGVRLGYAFGGGPKTPSVNGGPEGKAFLPFHAELRLTYYFGKGVLSRKGLRPYAHLSGGVAQIDTSVLVEVYPTREDYVADRTTSLHAWKKAGTSFVGIGGGLMYALTPKQGVFLDARFMRLFSESGTALSPQVGYMVGF
jgi:hypothetical protein